ncbi:MAG: pyridoxal-phosphate dependent enzyme [Planctomycetes bacterium]|nr:pyridoxal-phosphate dependent enzyme [Planctomycetota bacterium]
MPPRPDVQAHGPPCLRALCPTLDLPWVPLGQFPTPVERLSGLDEATGAEVWIKRDDRSGALYGGNKVRKLELLLARACVDGDDAAVTIGAYGSHHALATAIYARALGLRAHLVLYPQPLTEHVLDDLLLDHAFGAELTRVSHPVFAPYRSERVAARLGSAARIPAGGSNALGTVGFVEAGLELAAQVAEGALPCPDAIVVAAGTCGTAAGIALGCELAGLETRVVAVRVVPRLIANGLNLRRLRRGALALLRKAGLGAPLQSRVPVTIETQQLGRGYGASTPAAEDAVRRMAAVGIEVETTYTGKAAAALFRPGAFAEQRVLFWHTYSSVDLSSTLAEVDPRALPAAFRPVLIEGGRLPAEEPCP